MDNRTTYNRHNRAPPTGRYQKLICLGIRVLVTRLRGEQTSVALDSFAWTWKTGTTETSPFHMLQLASGRGRRRRITSRTCRWSRSQRSTDDKGPHTNANDGPWHIVDRLIVGCLQQCCFGSRKLYYDCDARLEKRK
jgi:hypothetical protein